jgi:Fe-S-cluster containining protein
MAEYMCDCCGACCQGHLIVEAYDIDLIREPQLASADLSRTDWSAARVMADLQQDGRCLVIAGGRACPFLDRHCLCSIYPTRPNVCVAMEAGDEECQMARSQAGLAPLEAIVTSETPPNVPSIQGANVR